MARFDTILWDVDGTLLDFGAAEEAAIRSLFADFGLGLCTDAMLARYSEINRNYWRALERGELTKAEILPRYSRAASRTSSPQRGFPALRPRSSTRPTRRASATR